MTVEEGKEWKKVAIRLAKCLDRFDEDCHIMSHYGGEYHEARDFCPVIEELFAAKKEFYDLIIKFKEK